MIKRPKGTVDILGDEVPFWHFFEKTAREVSRVFGFSEIRTPAFEMTELFVRSVGSNTDIVQKEMYAFEDKGGRSLCLRPEGTAPAMRAFLENALGGQGLPQKLYYMGPMFRYERPQAGRQRQFHQYGVELVGSPLPEADVEVIWSSIFLLDRLHLHHYDLHLNSLGCEADREKYRQALKEYYAPHLPNMCEDCQRRYDTNILRLLDCKVPKDAELRKRAPVITDFLCDSCRSHLHAVQDRLEKLQIPFTLNPHLVRGLDYYTSLVFEVKYPYEDSVFDILGGGRYDRVVEELGGKPTPSVGFACGIERLVKVMQSDGVQLHLPPNAQVFVLGMGEQASERALKIVEFLRKRGISVEQDLMGRNMRSQLKYASRQDFSLCVIIGENEINEGVCLVKDMETGMQTSVEDSWVENYLLEKLEE
ncbi:MAG TPA: histidine--tRNA ligase [Thermotogota bacterium]|nr:histidine--tRNA ligase [Thermotogota bacterium]HRW92490.1 histidine--tRNA ligase [Thermotogota bacterium]